ncbi:fibrinogen-related protein 3-2 [Plakobranchus ocellatus]|uniref:Fibrinogen-related protein 3-2 n=1 Tax=Plakobranchus ocellatus TaxID=259542 RepID=A0AAV4DF74_9GAST|nr:fibrinogen-related protein 3-2 [Plakobranchus ocellatus]
MKNELSSTAALILICFNACCEGINLVFNRDIQVVVGSRITCGILLCEERLTQTNTSSSSIINMTVFKNQPGCSRTLEDESETRVLMASINSKHRKISRITDATQAFGLLRSWKASLRIEMFKPGDCSSDFTCEVQGLDSQGRSFLSTTTLLQQQGDKHMGYEILANSLREIKDKMEAVRNQVLSLENRMDTLENRMEDKIDAKLSAIKNQVHSLESRMEDFIDAKLSAIKNQVQSLENRIEDKIDAKLSAIEKDDTHELHEAALDKKLSTLRRELSDEQQNAVTIIIDSMDVRFSLNQVQLIHKLRDSISEVISSSDNLIANLKPSIVDIMQPSTCKRGMIRPSSSYPYPHPVIYPRDGNGQGLPYLCDMFTDGGGWIVIQRRSSLFNVDFDRSWDTYKKGFGTFDDEFWLGNERIHAFTSSGTWELRVDLKYKGKEAYALYSNFKVESELEQYKLRFGNYSGTAGNSLAIHNGVKFSTQDRDNDERGDTHCAKKNTGGWWYINKSYCSWADLNSKKSERKYSGIEWDAFADEDSCSFSEMKMRRVA